MNKRNIHINNLIENADILVRNFAKNSNAISVELKNYGPKQAVWDIWYNLIKIEFVFKKKATACNPMCTLFARIYLNKMQNSYFHIPELIKDIDKDDFKCYYFTYIESKERMEACINVLIDFFTQNLDKIRELTSIYEHIDELNNEKISEVSDVVFRFKEKKKTEIIDCLNRDDFVDDVEYNQKLIERYIKKVESYIGFQLDKEDREKLYNYYKSQINLEKKYDMQNVIDDYMEVSEDIILLSRFTDADNGYRAYLDGNYKKALKYYKKLDKRGKIVEYEKRLITFIEMKIKNNESYKAIDEACDAYKAYVNYNKKIEDKRAIFSSFFICETIAGSVFAILLFIYNTISSKGTAYYQGVPAVTGYLYACISAIFVTFAFQRHFVYKFHNRNTNDIKNFDILTNKYLEQCITNAIAVISLGIGIILSVYIPRLNVKFYDTYMIYTYESEEELSLPKEIKCNYDKLVNVYYTDGVTNDYGDFIKRPSYVLEFENNVYWDSDGNMNIEDVKKNVLPILKGYYDDVIKVKDRAKFEQ